MEKDWSTGEESVFLRQAIARVIDETLNSLPREWGLLDRDMGKYGQLTTSWLPEEKRAERKWGVCSSHVAHLGADMNLGLLPGKMDQKDTWKVDMRHTILRQPTGMGGVVSMNLRSLLEKP